MNSVTNGTLSATNAVANETAIPFATAGKFRGKSPLHIGVANGMDNLSATAGKSRKVSRLRISVANRTANLFATAGKSRGKSPLLIGVANGMVNLFATAGKFRKVSRLRISVANGTANLFATVGQPALIKRNPNSTLSQKCTFLNFGPSTR